LMSRIRIVVDEKDSSKIVREIVSIGDPVAVDLEVNIKEKYYFSKTSVFIFPQSFSFYFN